MAKKLNTLASRVILVGLAVHAVLLPLLFYGLMTIVRQSNEERFIDDVRQYSRFLADLIELEGNVDDESQTTRLLDSAVLGSGVVYAELVEGKVRLQSQLSTVFSMEKFVEDFAFGEHADHIYFISTHLNIPAREVVLRLGFDELPVIEQVKSAQQRLLLVLLVYLAISIIVFVFLVARLTKPLAVLQRASRRIAKGRYDDQLQVGSKILEISDLANDLDFMRREIVGVNLSLQQKISDKEVADKDREVLEGKLRQMHKMETVGVMAGGISHEFNNILVPIILYTELAMNDLPAASPARAKLERVLKAANRARILLQQILTFSRQSEKPVFRPVDVKAVIKEVLDLMRALMPSTIELHRQITADRCMVMANQDQLHQMLMNLCSNAYHAIDDTSGSITVTVDVCDVDQRLCRDHPKLHVGQYVRMSIQDTGHGISRSNLERVFEPFYTTRAVGQGTGLGLSVVHGIIVAHGGDITVASEPGSGATFIVYLPVTEEVHQEENDSVS